MDNTKQIIIIVHSDITESKGGIGRRIVPILEELYSTDKYKLYIYARSADKKIKTKHNIYTIPKIFKFIIQGFTYINTKIDNPKINKIQNKINSYFFLKEIKKIEDIKNIDIVHSWDYFHDIYKYVKINNNNCKIIQDVPIGFSTILKNIKDKEMLWPNKKFILPQYIKESLPIINKFIVPSEFTKKTLINENINNDKIKIIPFGVDISKFKPSKNKFEKFSIAFVGNINNRKGIYYLIKAWNELNLKNSQLNLYGHLYPEVKKYLSTRNNNIITHGFVNITKELPKNHIYVFPSLLEGSSKSIYEAMACELPVISTINSGPIYKDNIEGFIIDAQSIIQIKEKILYFYNDRKKIIEYGKNGRKLVLNFTWENYAIKVIENYK